MAIDQAFYPLRHESVNPALITNTIKAIEKLFPIKTEDGSTEIRISNVQIDAKKVDPNALNAHQNARQTGKSQDAPIYGDLQLIQNGKQGQTLPHYNIGSLPLMNALGTFMVNGNDYYTPMAQLRLKPGAYTREKTNGEYETFIPMKGAQISVWMDPARGLLKLGFYSTNVSWYAIVRALGASDDSIVQTLGNDARARELLVNNQLKNPEADVKKLFLAIFERNINRDLVRAGVQKRNVDLASVDYAGQVVAIKQWFDGQELDPYVTAKTLGKPISRAGIDLLLQSARRILGVSRHEEAPDDRDAPEFKGAFGIEEMLPERIAKQAKYLQRKVLQRLRGGDVSLSRAFGKEWLSPVTTSYFGGTENIEGGLANTAEAANPLAILSEQSKLTLTGEGGIGSDHAITIDARLFRPSSTNFIDLTHTPEGCFDFITEVMTFDGWKPWPEATKDDLFACNINGRVEYHKPKAMIVAPYNGIMYGASTTTVEYLVTPNHRMWVTPGCKLKDGSTSVFRFEYPEEVSKTNRLLQCGGHKPLIGTLESFTFPSVVGSSALKNHDSPIDIGDWCELMGWYLAEGHWYIKDHKHYHIGITQDFEKNPENTAMIEGLLSKLPFKWCKHGAKRFSTGRKQLALYFKQFGKCANLFIPEEVFNAPEAARRRFVDAILRGDGRKRPKKYGGFDCLCTTSENLAENFQHLLFELGVSSCIVFEPDTRKPKYTGCYCVHIHQRNVRKVAAKTTRKPGGNFFTEDYNGLVYCAEVPGGLLYVRRNNRSGFWCGNSQIGVMTHAAVNVVKDGTKLRAPFYRVFNGQVDKSKPIMLSTEEASDAIISYPEYFDKNGKAKEKEVRVNIKGEIQNVDVDRVQYMIPSGASAFDHTSNAALLLAHTHPNRGMMAGKHLTQALPLVQRESPLFALNDASGRNVLGALARTFTIRSRVDGKVEKIEPNGITIDGERHEIYDQYPMQAKVALHHYPVVKVGDKVKKGDLIADSNYSRDGQLALGTNLRSAYMPWKNAAVFEDAILISQSAAKKLTSEHLHRCTLDLAPEISVNRDLAFAQFPTHFTADSFKKLDTSGIVKEGSLVRTGDPLIAAVRKSDVESLDRRSENLSRIHKTLMRPYRDASVYWDELVEGTVYRIIKTKDKIEIHVKTAEPMEIGDKLSMSSAAKGTISQIVDDDKMPHNKEGQHIEVIFNTHGVAGRINPSQTIEQAIGKLVRDGGGSYSIENFDNVHHAKEVNEALKEKGLTHEESLFDPESGKWLEKPVATGYNYVVKLDHSVRKKFSARSTGSYTMDETPTSGGGKGGQSYDQLTTYALLGHNAHAIVGESVGIRGTKNEDWFRAYQAGETPPPPKVPFAFHKLEAYLNAAGVDTKTHGNVMSFMPMTDKRVLERSNGEVTNATLLKTRAGKDKALAEERGGLFDPTTTGGLFGSKWTHISLAEKIPHPLYEKVVRDLTGLKTADYYGLLAHTRHYDPATKKFSEERGSNTITGSTAFEHLLDFDPDERMKEIKAKIKTAVGSDQNKLNRASRYIRGLKETGMKPAEAYLVKNIPVIPPTYRGITEMSGGALRVADPNLLYRDVLLTNEQVQKAKEAGMPSEHMADARTTLYKSIGALVGINNPLTHREDREDAKGFIDIIKGKNNKEGFFQRVVARRRNDFTGRSTIEPDANLGVDEIGIPEEMAWKIYQPCIIRRLVGLGYNPADAQKSVEEHKPEARQALLAEMEHRPVIYNRAPSLHRWSVGAAHPTLTPGKEIKISPGIVGPTNSDFDGDDQLNCILVKFSTAASIALGKQFIGEHMAARFEAELPVKQGEHVCIVHLEDFPHGDLIGSKQGKNGLIDFYSTIPGTQVLAYDETKQCVEWKDVTGWSRHHDRIVEIVELRSGREIYTDDDPRAVYGVQKGTLDFCRMSPTDALQKGMIVPRSDRFDATVQTDIVESISIDKSEKAAVLNDEIELTTGFGYCLGVIAGNGWVSSFGGKDRDVCIAGLNNNVQSACEKELTKLFIWAAPEASINNRDLAGSQAYGPSQRYTYTSVELAANVKRWIGSNAHSKHLPPFFLTSPVQFREGLFAGLMDTDGSISVSKGKDKPQLMSGYSSVCLRLVQEIRWLASSLGIKSRITPSSTPAGKPFFQLTFSSLDIQNWGGKGMQNTGKLKSLSSVERINPAATSLSSQDMVPISAKLATYFLSRFCNSDSIKVTLYKSRKTGLISRNTARNLLPVGNLQDTGFQKWKRIVEDTNITWEEVREVRKGSARQTGYDLTVPGHETFVSVDGIVLSNTMSITVPITEAARIESHNLLPSKNLFYERDKSLAYTLDKDIVTGIFALTKPGAASGLTYDSEDEAIDAYKNNKNSSLKMGSLVTIKGKGQQAIGWLIFQKLLPVRFLSGLSAPVDGKKLKTLMERIAKESPGDYNVLSRKIMQAGFNAAAMAGGITATVGELVVNRGQIDSLLKQMETDISKGKTYQDRQRIALEAKRKYEPLIHAELQKHFDAQDIGYKTLLESKSSSKFNMDTFNQMLGSPMLMTDVHDQVVPSVIKTAYGSGMTLSDYVLTTPGARKGLVARSLATALPGFLAKEISANMGPIRIETKDCGTQKGITLELDPDQKLRGHDLDLLDRHLLHDVAVIQAKRNDVVTPEMLSRLRDHNVKTIEVRSAMTCAAPNPPCQLCAGRDSTGTLWPIGTNIGLNYGQGISERSTQMVMKLFHSGGTIGSGDSLMGGFARFRELLSAPETIKNQGSLADVSGRVVSVRPAPQGGYYIKIQPSSGAEVEQHILQGRTVKVKSGDNVEIGDELSDGSFRPQEIALKKGSIAAQQYVVDQARKSYLQAGEIIRKPVLEVLVSGMMRYVKITDDGGEADLTVGDTIHENDFELRRHRNPSIKGEPTLPGISGKPLLSNDLMERLNFQRLETAISDVPASGGKSDLTGSRSPIAGIAYGAKFRMEPQFVREGI